MNSFRIDTQKAYERADALAWLKRQLTEYAGTLEQSASDLQEEALSGIRASLGKLSSRICREAEQAGKLKNGLEIAAKQYTAAEERLKTPVPSAENPAFDTEGSYGGSQCTPLSAFLQKDGETSREIRRVVKSYYPEYSDREIENMMRDLEAEGCGYVALANTLFGWYAGRADQFQAVFGFPMYNGLGELNYELLTADVYCAEDNRRKIGTTMEEREEIWENYLKDHNVPVDVRTVKVEAENYEELSWDGEIIASVNPCILLDENGEKVIDEKGGHAVTVTGVTEDGLLRVSSWGMEYYILPDDPAYERVQFQQICYGEKRH